MRPQVFADDGGTLDVACRQSDEHGVHGERRRHVRLHFKPDERIPVSVQLPSAGTVSADLVNISLSGLCLRFSPQIEAHKLNGELLVVFPTLERNDDALRFRVVYCRCDSLGLWVGLSLPRSANAAQQQKNQRLSRAAVLSMHQVRMAQWLLQRQRGRDNAT